MSIDALRGFSMFWIIGADDLFRTLSHIHGRGIFRNIARQFRHKAWEGFSFYDLIFPLFIFIVGVSITFSLPQLFARAGWFKAWRHILWRGMILFLLGIFYNGGLGDAFEDIRYAGVLQRIAICYILASAAFLYLGARALFAVFVAILLGYWALMALVPVPGYGPPTVERGVNLADYIDEHYLPGSRYTDDHDPEGILSTLPAVATCLLGIMAGRVLRDSQMADQHRFLILMCGGIVCFALGQLWSLSFPVIKELWTSSFVLVAGGCSCVLLALFHELIDARKWRLWARPFVWLGMNSIFLYVVTGIVAFDEIAQRLVGGDIGNFLDEHLGDGFGDLAVSLVALGLTVWLAYVMHRRKIYIKV